MVLDAVCALVLGALGAAVVIRMAYGVRATRIAPVAAAPPAGAISVIVPVLDEAERIGTCMHGLLASGPEVGEILIVDGGSRDDTIAYVRRLTAGDARVRVIDAAPIPDGWNGKAWGLDVGLRATRSDAKWIATVDADVRPTGGLFAAMVAHAQARDVAALSVATRQLVAGPLTAIVHPAMLTTLIYRFGLPGREATRVAQVQANGQCFLAKRALLLAHGAFDVVRTSRCEDVTLARALVAAGVPVGFYEAGNLVNVQMHANWRDAWCNWPRSLTLRDRFARYGGWFGITEVALVQALPLPLTVALAIVHATGTATFAVAAILTCVRFGVLAGAARAYVVRPWTYWLSPLADVPVACALIVAALRRRHVWRGRELVLAETRG
jgi:dolichol-phosphate mannosyltransferase